MSAPDDSLLRQFLLGRLSAAEAGTVEAYLETHPEAAAVLDRLDADDPLVAALRGRTADPGVPPEVETLASRLVLLDAELTRTAGRSDANEVTGEATTDSPTAFLAPATGPGEVGRLGDFRILRVLGRGGMGVVFEAEDPALGRRVAVKAMLPKLAADRIGKQRFVREAQAAAAVEHDHVVPIHLISEAGGVPFLVMPFLKGESLDDRLKREPILPIPEVLRMGRETAEGLAAAHEKGLVHRDVKPANLWLEAGPRRQSGEFRVKILDFGLARPATAAPGVEITQSGAVLGTPAYMSPEQGRGLPVDYRTDLFSLGGVLYRAATGRTPFAGSDAAGMLMALAADTPVDPRSLNPNIPPTLADLIQQLLEKDPAKRPHSAAEVARLLAAIEPAPAAPLPATPSAAVSSTADTEVVPPVAPARRGPRVGRWAAVAVAVLLIGVTVSFAPTIIRIATNKGELVVEVEDDTIEVVVKGTTVEVLDPKGKRYLVSAGKDGEVEIREKGTDAVLVTEKFRVRRGDRTVVTVSTTKLAAARKKEGPPAVPPGPASRELAVGEVRVFRGHEGAVMRGLAFSSDGKRIVSGGADKTARLWDVETGEEVACFRGHSAEVTCVAISPDRQMVAAQFDATDRSLVVVWDVNSGKELHRFTHGAPNGCGVAFSPDSSRVASSCFDGHVRVWDLKTKQQIALFAINSWILRVAFSPDGKSVACGVWDGSAQIWDVATQKRVHRLPGAKGIVESVAYSRDGKYLLSTGADDGTVRMWDTSTGKQIQTFTVASTVVRGVTFTPDADYMLSAHEDKVVRLWDVGTGQVVKSYDHHNGRVESVAVSPDGRLAASCGWDGTVRMWRLPVLTGGADAPQVPAGDSPPAKDLYAGKLLAYETFDASGLDALVPVPSQGVNERTIQGGAAVVRWPAGKPFDAAGYYFGPPVRDAVTVTRFRATNARPLVNLLSHRNGERVAWLHFTILPSGDWVLSRYDADAKGQTPNELARSDAPADDLKAGQWVTVATRTDGPRYAIWVNGRLATRGVAADLPLDQADWAPMPFQLGGVVTGDGPARLEIDYAAVWKLPKSSVPGGGTGTHFQPVLVDGGDWKMDGDELVQTRPEVAALMFGDPAWTDYDVEVETRTVPGPKNAQGSLLYFRATARNNYMNFNLGSYGGTGDEVAYVRAGKWGREPAGFRRAAHQLDQWCKMRVEVRGNKGRCFLDDKEVFAFNADQFPAGRVGVGTWNTSIRWRNLKVTAPDGRVLFQGFPTLPSQPERWTGDQPPPKDLFPGVQTASVSFTGTGPAPTPVFGNRQAPRRIRDGVLITDLPADAAQDFAIYEFGEADPAVAFAARFRARPRTTVYAAFALREGLGRNTWIVLDVTPEGYWFLKRVIDRLVDGHGQISDRVLARSDTPDPDLAAGNWVNLRGVSRGPETEIWIGRNGHARVIEDDNPGAGLPGLRPFGLGAKARGSGTGFDIGHVAVWKLPADIRFAPQSHEELLARLSSAAQAPPRDAFAGSLAEYELFDNPSHVRVPVGDKDGVQFIVRDGVYQTEAPAAKAEWGTGNYFGTSAGANVGFVVRTRRENAAMVVNFRHRVTISHWSWLELRVEPTGEWNVYRVTAPFVSGGLGARTVTRIAKSENLEADLASGRWVNLVGRATDTEYEIWANGRRLARGLVGEALTGTLADPVGIQVFAFAPAAGKVRFELDHVAVWNLSPNPFDFREVHGATEEGIQEWARNLPAGFRPISISARSGVASPTFDAIAVPDASGRRWKMAVLTDNSDQALGKTVWDENTKDGSIQFSATQYISGRSMRELQVYSSGSELFEAWVGSPESIRGKLERVVSKGWRVTSIGGIQWNNQIRVSAQFHQGVAPQWEYRDELKADELARVLGEYRAKGWRPSILSAYVNRSPARYLGVFEVNGTGVEWDFKTGLTVTEFEKDLASRKASGQRPQCLWSENTPTGVAYSVVWIGGQTADPDRRAAEWVLSIGGQVTVDSPTRNAVAVTGPGGLPPGQFVLRRVAMPREAAITDDDFNRFKGLGGLHELTAIYTPVGDRALEHLSGLTSLRRLNLALDGQPGRITDDGLKHLAGLRDLEFLDVGGHRVTGPGLAHLVKLPRLYQLAVRRSQFDDAAVPHLLALTALRDLAVTGTRLSERGLTQLAGNRSLFALNISGPAVTDAVLAEVVRNPGLTDLGLGGAKVSPGRLAGLAALTKLVRLDVTATPFGDPELKALAGLTRLRSLYLVKTKVSDSGLAGLAALRELEALSLAETGVTDAGLDAFRSLGRLRNLYLKGTKVSEAGVKKLAAARPDLWMEYDGGVIEPKPAADPDRRAAEWVLSVDGMVRVFGTDRDIRRIADLPAGPIVLQTVFLRGCDKVTDEGLAVFKDCKTLFRLHHLDLRETPVTDAGLAHFKECRDLLVLDLPFTRVGDAGLAHFQDCLNLTSLWLGTTNVTDKGLSYFKGCKRLIHLDLWKTDVTDAGLAHFQGCNGLFTLLLGGTKVTDTALKNFKDCRDLRVVDLKDTLVSDASIALVESWTTLNELNLTNTFVSPSGHASIQKALPKCKLHWELNPDRPAAEWVLSVGGFVDIVEDGKNRKIRAGERLPDARFRLTSVDVRGPKVTDAGLAVFRGCRNLTYLIVQSPNVTDAGLANFKDCKRLGYLNLEGTALTNAGLDTFAGNAELTGLALPHTTITDAAVDRLAGFSKLRALNVKSTKVTEAGSKKLVAALPKCKVEWEKAGPAAWTGDKPPPRDLFGEPLAHETFDDPKLALPIPLDKPGTPVGVADGAKVIHFVQLGEGNYSSVPFGGPAADVAFVARMRGTAVAPYAEFRSRKSATRSSKLEFEVEPDGTWELRFVAWKREPGKEWDLVERKALAKAAAADPELAAAKWFTLAGKVQGSTVEVWANGRRLARLTAELPDAELPPDESAIALGGRVRQRGNTKVEIDYAAAWKLAVPKK